MSQLSIRSLLLFLLYSLFSSAQQQCYFGPGAENRGPANLVPCMSSGAESACCLLGDSCFSGNVCYNYASGDLYQYGCTDINYQDASCPFKCGFDAAKSPWTALEFCTDIPSVTDTWVCHAPESCGCARNFTTELLTLHDRGCKEMGSQARVALYAPSKLAPYVSLPSTYGGSTGYYSPTTISGTSSWALTAINGYTPASIGPLTTYSNSAPTSVVQVDPHQTPSPSTWPAALPLNSTSGPTPNAVATSPTSSVVTSTSAGTPSSTTTAAASSGLSTGVKAGIGVGVVGAVCLLAAPGIAILLLRKRRNTNQPQASTPNTVHAADAQYANKPTSWQAPPPPPDSPYGYSHHPRYAPPYRGTPAWFHEIPTSQPLPQQSGQKKASSPAMELTAERPAQEMESVTAISPVTPAPTYKFIEGN